MSVYTVIKEIAGSKRSISSIEKHLNISNGTIGKWDSSMPRADTLRKVADYLGTTTAYILDKAKED
ncbi:helix-turn-helix domain-containing protein [Jeotgalibaca porci]|uniref:helix-turn-helix domain-containing protein n=1 Tax=Jeotgalibaca porci TaxID=1868793 RepID=UPI0035A0F651